MESERHRGRRRKEKPAPGRRGRLGRRGGEGPERGNTAGKTAAVTTAEGTSTFDKIIHTPEQLDQLHVREMAREPLPDTSQSKFHKNKTRKQLLKPAKEK